MQNELTVCIICSGFGGEFDTQFVWVACMQCGGSGIITAADHIRKDHKVGIKYVTLTGADDSVYPQEILELAQLFPFAEWGILVAPQSPSRSRFPSYGWIKKLCELNRENGNQLRLSLHLCGGYLEQLAHGELPLVHTLGPYFRDFQRCQLNWHGERTTATAAAITAAFEQLRPEWAPEVIFQLDGVNDELAFECAKLMPHVSGLLDRSHGAGIVPERWPPADDYLIPVGYAGGLGPENLIVEIPDILAMAAGTNIWIDMETNLFARGADGVQWYFSIARAACCLATAKPYTV